MSLRIAKAKANWRILKNLIVSGRLWEIEKWKIEKALEESQTLSDGKIGDACQKKKQGILFWKLDLNKILAKKFFQEILWEKGCWEPGFDEGRSEAEWKSCKK
jgi:hypothetical protein